MTSACPNHPSPDTDALSIARAVDQISSAVAAAFMIPPNELHAATRRQAPVALARQSAMYLAHVSLGLNFTDAGQAFGRTRTTAARACQAIEERREDASLNTTLVRLEQALRRDENAGPGAAA